MRRGLYVRTLRLLPVVGDFDRGAPWVVDKFMRFKLASLFAGAFDAADYSPLPVTIPMPSASDISRAAKLILGAKRPLLIMGSQVRGRGTMSAGDGAQTAAGAPATGPCLWAALTRDRACVGQSMLITSAAEKLQAGVAAMGEYGRARCRVARGTASAHESRPWL